MCYSFFYSRDRGGTMNIIVQKFGGTSVASQENREKVMNKIIKQYESGYNTVAVVSAMGRMGEPYATDTLLSLVGNQKIHLREKDLLMSCGEVISAVILSNLLNSNGYESIVLTGHQAGIITDDNFGSAKVLKVNPHRILESLNQGKIVIVTGFQGATEDGDITTLGRGGSDTSAVLIGEALNCEYVEIYTDVDGIMTADPRIVPEARVLENMCYLEVHQLAEEGAKVIHPKAVEIAKRSRIKLIIKNTLNECAGTIIKDKNDWIIDNDTNQKLISAITYKKNRTQVVVDNCDNNNTEKLLSLIAEDNISLDLINFFVDKKAFTIDENDIEHIVNILDDGKYTYNIVHDCCKISIIGYKIRGIPGVMASIVKALSKEGIDILQTSDSYTTIWCLIKSKDMDKCLNILHKEFNLGI